MLPAFRFQCVAAGVVVLLVVPCPLDAEEGDARGVRAGDDVVLELSDGRVARGTLDGDSNESVVVLSSSLDGVELRSRFPRGRVLRIHPAEVFEVENETIRVVDEPPAPRVPQQMQPRPRDVPIDVDVRSLSIEAAPSNWDADPESDGLLVHVLPLDGYGEVVPTDGWLSLELTMEQFSTRRELPWERRRWPFFTPERWNVRLRREDFGRYGAYVEFPYRQLHPQFDLDVAPQALLRGRLVVRGEGVFEAADANVRIRPLSRFRDELEQLTGRRFLPAERTGRWPSSPSSRLKGYP